MAAVQQRTSERIGELLDLVVSAPAEPTKTGLDAAIGKLEEFSSALHERVAEENRQLAIEEKRLDALMEARLGGN
jgi:hypothetical protein